METLGEFSVKEEKLKRYLLAISIELTGIFICTAGLFEHVILLKSNPVHIFLTGGSLLIALGAFYFAKIVQWKRGK